VTDSLFKQSCVYGRSIADEVYGGKKGRLTVGMKPDRETSFLVNLDLVGEGGGGTTH